MVYKRFYSGVIIQVSLIVITCLLTGYFVFRTSLLSLPVHLILILALQVWLLIKYINVVNRNLKNFINSVINEDSSLKLTSQFKDKSFRELFDCLEGIRNKIQKSHMEKEVESHYHKHIIEHVGVGLLSFSGEGKIELINNSAKKMLSLKEVFNIKAFNRVYSGFDRILEDLKPNHHKLLKIKLGDELMQLSLKATEIKVLEKKIKLISFQNIKNELEESELDSWQKLIRVLTHEIMNSVAPITSAATTITRFFKTDTGSKSQSEIDDNIIGDTLAGLNAINVRGEGLLNFVDKYRSLTLIPKPDFKKFKISEIYRNIFLLMESEFKTKNIKFDQLVDPENLELTSDIKLIEQILLNLIRNSLEALEGRESKILKLDSCVNVENRIIVRVIDNGTGIPKENIEKVFVPFYTTKEKGSGIGLSLSRQIMRQHGGTISVYSEPE